VVKQMPLQSFFSLAADAGAMASVPDPFAMVEIYAFRTTLLIIFVVALYRLVRQEIRK
jgi:hypothetical protein